MKKHQHESLSLIVWVDDADMANKMIRVGSSSTRKRLIMTSRIWNSDESKHQTVCQMALECFHTIYLPNPAAMSLANERLWIRKLLDEKEEQRSQMQCVQNSNVKHGVKSTDYLKGKINGRRQGSDPTQFSSIENARVLGWCKAFQKVMSCPDTEDRKGRNRNGALQS